MKKRLHKRLMNSAVWAYTIANAVLVSVAALSFLAGNETITYIAVIAEIIVNVLATINNPDFKGMVKDKEYIVDTVEDAANTAQVIHESIEKVKNK